MTMAQPSSSSQPNPSMPPAYDTVDIEAEYLTPTSLRPCPTCKHSPRDPRSGIHALLGLQDARDPNYHEKDFIAKLVTLIFAFVALAGFLLLALITRAPAWVFWWVVLLWACLSSLA